MRRITLVVIYLAAAALTVIVVNAHPENELEGAALVLWAFASLLLGWGTGQPLWALLVILVVAFAERKSATPIFKRMLTSHQAALQRARGAGEPAGQLAARELEVQRINSALRRAGDLDDDVAAAIEAA
jgi:hypothetical protein